MDFWILFKNIFTTYFYSRRSTGLFLSRLSSFLFLAVFTLFGYFLFLAFPSIFFTSIPWYSKHRDTFFYYDYRILHN